MAKNIIKVLLSNMFVTLLGIINGFVFPVIMTIDGYAHYQVFLLYASYFSVCHLGLANGMYINYAGKNMRSINKARYKSEIRLLLVILAPFFVVSVSCALIFQNVLWLQTSLAMFPICIVGSYRALYQSWNRFTAFSIINVIPNLFLTTIIIISFITCDKIDIDLPIYAYIFIYSVLTLWFLTETYFLTKGIQANKICSRENFLTLRSGFLVHIGAYISLILHSLDKQFVRIFYTTDDFAMYAFALSALNMILIVVNSLTQPLYLSLVLSNNREDYSKKVNLLKDILLVFGAFFASAYFMFSFVITNYIDKYKGALDIIAVYFAVLPGIAVINVLYSNLYKVKQLLKRYIVVLLQVTVGVILLNFISILLNIGAVGIACATTICYYIWLIYSKRDLNEICFQFHDVVFLVVFGGIYLFTVRLYNPFLGIVMYIVAITFWSFIMYKSSIMELFNIIIGRKKNPYQFIKGD